MSDHNFMAGETVIRMSDKQIGFVRSNCENILIMGENWSTRIIQNPNWDKWSSFVSLHDYREDKQYHMDRIMRTGQLVVGTPGEAKSFIVHWHQPSFSENVLDNPEKCPYITFDKERDSYLIPASVYEDYAEWIIDQYMI